MKSFIFLFSLCFIFSCKQHESKFDIEKDLYRFSEKMEEGDTIVININYSACMYSAHEIFTFTKQKDITYIQTHSEINSFEHKEQNLPKIIYKIRPSAPLSFESYFKYLKRRNRPKKETRSPLVTISLKNRPYSEAFYDDGLEDKFEKLDQFSLVRKNIYPVDRFFKSPEGPPPPPCIK
ncbi:hypothetical protein ACN9MN_14575 [Chryseobacterium sp. S-02]|uniref:hypothetical protein n=1 Tax=Chryseobacterium sp. S-02 TaxID=3404064 RepID=UPI003CF7FEBB